MFAPANVGRNDRRRRRRTEFRVAPGFSPGNKKGLEEPYLAAAGRAQSEGRSDLVKPTAGKIIRKQLKINRLKEPQFGRLIPQNCYPRYRERKPAMSGLFYWDRTGPPAK